MLQTEAPGFDGVRSTVESTSFGDLMHATQGLSGRVTAEIGEQAGHLAESTSHIMMIVEGFEALRSGCQSDVHSQSEGSSENSPSGRQPISG